MQNETPTRYQARPRTAKDIVLSPTPAMVFHLEDGIVPNSIYERFRQQGHAKAKSRLQAKKRQLEEEPDAESSIQVEESFVEERREKRKTPSTSSRVSSGSRKDTSTSDSVHASTHHSSRSETSVHRERVRVPAPVQSSPPDPALAPVAGTQAPPINASTTQKTGKSFLLELSDDEDTDEWLQVPAIPTRTNSKSSAVVGLADDIMAKISALRSTRSVSALSPPDNAMNV